MGKKRWRITVRFSLANYDYLCAKASQHGISVTAELNRMIAMERDIKVTSKLATPKELVDN